MDERLTKYLDGVFAPYEDSEQVRELKEELLGNLQEKLNDFKRQGLDDETAYRRTIGSVGNVSEILEAASVHKAALLEMARTDFSDTDLSHSDMKQVKVHAGNFDDATLKGADFSGSDLTGSSFNDSELKNTRFDGANLTGASLYRSDLRGASFNGCVLDNTDFNGSDLSGVLFDNQTFSGTIFDEALLKGTSFRNATFKRVSFKEAIDLKKASFEGASMDSFTYSYLKGTSVNLSGITLI